MSFRVAATIALARAGDLNRPGHAWRRPSGSLACGRAGHGAPPSGRRAGCSAGPKATTRRQPRCSRRPPNSSPRRTGPSTRPGAELRPPPPPDLDGHPDRLSGRLAFAIRPRGVRLDSPRKRTPSVKQLSVLPALDSLHPPISQPSGTSRPARVLLKAGMVGAGGVEPPAPSVSGHARLRGSIAAMHGTTSALLTRVTEPGTRCDVRPRVGSLLTNC